MHRKFQDCKFLFEFSVFIMPLSVIIISGRHLLIKYTANITPAVDI